MVRLLLFIDLQYPECIIGREMSKSSVLMIDYTADAKSVVSES